MFRRATIRLGIGPHSSVSLIYSLKATSAIHFITSDKEDMFSSLLVCLSVLLLAILHKNVGTNFHEIFRERW